MRRLRLFRVFALCAAAVIVGLSVAAFAAGHKAGAKAAQKPGVKSEQKAGQKSESKPEAQSQREINALYDIKPAAAPSAEEFKASPVALPDDMHVGTSKDVFSVEMGGVTLNPIPHTNNDPR